MSAENNLFALGNAQTGATTNQPEPSHSAMTQAKRQIDIIHMSFLVVIIIVTGLLGILALPVFGFMPIASKSEFIIMCVVAFSSIGYLHFLNYKVHNLFSDHARLTEVLVNSLGQGFLTFGPDGLCENVYSQACADLLEVVPAGKHIMDLLRVPPEGRDDFKDWLGVLFVPNHALGFQDVVNFFPHLFSHSRGRRIILSYRPIYSKPGVLARVVLIATDETEEYAAQELAQQRQDYADMICRVFRERNQFLATLAYVRRFIEEAALPIKREEAPSLLRLLHTLKGAVMHFHFNDMGNVVHQLETDLNSKDIKSDAQFNEVLAKGRKRIEVSLDEMLDKIKEMVGQDYHRRGNVHEIEEDALYHFAIVMEASKVSPDIIDQYMRLLVAVPIRTRLQDFDREVMDLGEFTGKPLKPVNYTGSDLPILPRPLHPLIFSFTHIARNIIDHGIEAAVTRLARGKDPIGLITVHTEVEARENGQQWLLISISDDGAGVDPARVRSKLEKVNPDGAWRAQNDHEVIQNIFSWGFSTLDIVTDLSGRGVGMEAVEREVHNLGGKIEVFSELSKGTRFDIRVPYKLSV